MKSTITTNNSIPKCNERSKEEQGKSDQDSIKTKARSNKTNQEMKNSQSKEQINVISENKQLLPSNYHQQQQDKAFLKKIKQLQIESNAAEQQDNKQDMKRTISDHSHNLPTFNDIFLKEYLVMSQTPNNSDCFKNVTKQVFIQQLFLEERKSINDIKGIIKNSRIFIESPISVISKGEGSCFDSCFQEDFNGEQFYRSSVKINQSRKLSLDDKKSLPFSPMKLKDSMLQSPQYFKGSVSSKNSLTKRDQELVQSSIVDEEQESSNFINIYKLEEESTKSIQQEEGNLTNIYSNPSLPNYNSNDGNTQMKSSTSSGKLKQLADIIAKSPSKNYSKNQQDKGCSIKNAQAQFGKEEYYCSAQDQMKKNKDKHDLKNENKKNGKKEGEDKKSINVYSQSPKSNLASFVKKQESIVQGLMTVLQEVEDQENQKFNESLSKKSKSKSKEVKAKINNLIYDHQEDQILETIATKEILNKQNNQNILMDKESELIDENTLTQEPPNKQNNTSQDQFMGIASQSDDQCISTKTENERSSMKDLFFGMGGVVSAIAIPSGRELVESKNQLITKYNLSLILDIPHSPKQINEITESDKESEKDPISLKDITEGFQTKEQEQESIKSSEKVSTQTNEEIQSIPAEINIYSTYFPCDKRGKVFSPESVFEEISSSVQGSSLAQLRKQSPLSNSAQCSTALITTPSSAKKEKNDKIYNESQQFSSEKKSKNVSKSREMKKNQFINLKSQTNKASHQNNSKINEKTATNPIYYATSPRPNANKLENNHYGAIFKHQEQQSAIQQPQVKSFKTNSFKGSFNSQIKETKPSKQKIETPNKTKHPNQKEGSSAAADKRKISQHQNLKQSVHEECADREQENANLEKYRKGAHNKKAENNHNSNCIEIHLKSRFSISSHNQSDKKEGDCANKEQYLKKNLTFKQSKSIESKSPFSKTSYQFKASNNSANKNKNQTSNNFNRKSYADQSKTPINIIQDIQSANFQKHEHSQDEKSIEDQSKTSKITKQQTQMKNLCEKVEPFDQKQSYQKYYKSYVLSNQERTSNVNHFELNSKNFPYSIKEKSKSPQKDNPEIEQKYIQVQNYEVSQQNGIYHQYKGSRDSEYSHQLSNSFGRERKASPFLKENTNSFNNSSFNKSSFNSTYQSQKPNYQNIKGLEYQQQQQQNCISYELSDNEQPKSGRKTKQESNNSRETESMRNDNPKNKQEARKIDSSNSCIKRKGKDTKPVDLIVLYKQNQSHSNKEDSLSKEKIRKIRTFSIEPQLNDNSIKIIPSLKNSILKLEIKPQQTDSHPSSLYRKDSLTKQQYSLNCFSNRNTNSSMAAAFKECNSYISIHEKSLLNHSDNRDITPRQHFENFSLKDEIQENYKTNHALLSSIDSASFRLKKQLLRNDSDFENRGQSSNKNKEQQQQYNSFQQQSNKPLQKSSSRMKQAILNPQNSYSSLALFKNQSQGSLKERSNYLKEEKSEELISQKEIFNYLQNCSNHQTPQHHHQFPITQHHQFSSSPLKFNFSTQEYLKLPQ